MTAGLISLGFVASGRIPAPADMWGEHKLNVAQCKLVSQSHLHVDASHRTLNFTNLLVVLQDSQLLAA